MQENYIYSQLFRLESIDEPEQIDEELKSQHAKYQNRFIGRTDKEIMDFLSKIPENKINSVLQAVLYIILIWDASATKNSNDGLKMVDNPEKHAQWLSKVLVTVDRCNFIIDKLVKLTSTLKWNKMYKIPKIQIFWLLGKMAEFNVSGLDKVYINLLRQIQGGSTTEENLWFIEALLSHVKHYRIYESSPKIIPPFVYAYLRLICEHSQYKDIQQQEIQFCVQLLTEKFSICMEIGRDLIRALQDVAQIPEFQKIWSELLENPTKFDPSFEGIEQILLTPTQKQCLEARITFYMEEKLNFYTNNVLTTNRIRYMKWFMSKYFTPPENASFIIQDVIRYICCVIYPTNKILQSPIVPRCIIIMDFIRAYQNINNNLLLSLLFDWLMFEPSKKDSVMNIEPAIKYIESSIKMNTPDLSATLINFLRHLVDQYCHSLSQVMLKHVKLSMHTILTKNVISQRTLQNIYNCPAFNETTRNSMKYLFGEFLNIEQKHLPMNNMNKQVSPTSKSFDTGNMIPLNPRVDDILNRFKKISSDKNKKYSRQDMKDLISLCLDGVELNYPILTKSLYSILKNDINKEWTSYFPENTENIDEVINQYLNNPIVMLFDELNKMLFKENKEIDDYSKPMIKNGLHFFKDLCNSSKIISARYLLNLLRDILWNKSSEFDSIKKYLDFLYSIEENNNGYNSASSSNNNNINSNSSSNNLNSNINSQSYSELVINDVQTLQEEDSELFLILIPVFCSYFSDVVIGNETFIYLIVSVLDPIYCNKISYDLNMHKYTLFNNINNISKVIEKSLEWESYEQSCLWTFIISEFGYYLDNNKYLLQLFIDEKVKFTKDNIEALNGISQLAKSLSPSKSVINLILRQPTVLFSNCFIFVLNYWLISNNEELEAFLKNALVDFRQHHKYNDNNAKSKDGKVDSQGISFEDEIFHSDNENDNDYMKFNADIYKDDVNEESDDDSDASNDNLITKRTNKKKSVKPIDDSDESFDKDDDTDLINIESDDEIDILENAASKKEKNLGFENDEDELFLYGDEAMTTDTAIAMPNTMLTNKNKTEVNDLIKLKEKSKKIKSENKDYTPAEINIVLENIRQWKNNLNQIKKNLINLKRSELELQAYDLFNNSELITDITSLIYEFSLQSQFKDLLIQENDIIKMDEIVESDDSDESLITSSNKRKRMTISDSE
ncbi:hypothetical protein BCR36DRAFT_345427 [Piromyces finnis]|uniref:Uncharacterized protein n=1 Tax=Piromyces finnis TaxID=1754191 RepID=A0A1Y1VIT7_9FUNG|nr:hypothetical protein BCR36DRAFT_345427 [Piromyces finnis]|eukprot:ORX57314.1 hypothetical protein BCR36DRAFT_345427 [Piromyces finnis]